jgi:hypothetical protein
MRVLFPSLLSLLAASRLFSAPPVLEGALHDAYATIKEEKTFCSTMVGAGGAVPKVVAAFRTLLWDAQADAAFKSLLTEAKPAGQLYALCGLWFTDPVAFKEAAENLGKSGDQVDTLIGCIGTRKRVADIVESKDPGAVRLKDNKQSVKQWLDEHKGGSMHTDIVGGYWPSMFKNEGGFRMPMKPDGGAGPFK